MSSCVCHSLISLQDCVNLLDVVILKQFIHVVVCQVKHAHQFFMGVAKEVVDKDVLLAVIWLAGNHPCYTLINHVLLMVL